MKQAERSYVKGDGARQRDYCPFAMVVGIERLVGDPSIVDSASHCNRSSPLAREPSVMVRSVG